MWKKKLYIKNNLTPFSINRSKIDLFFDCNRCFYLDQKHGIKRPHGAPLVINNFVVSHFKNTLNKYRSIEKVIPEIVHTRTGGIKGVKYEKIIPLLIEAIKDQQEQIYELKKKLEEE